MYINCLGSCVSRISLLRGEKEQHGIYRSEETGVKLQYFLDKHNIALAMMPAPFPREIMDSVTAEELFDSSRLRSMKQAIMKDTVPLLLSSDAEYLVMDFYDFHNSFLVYQNTAFSTQAAEFLNTKLFVENQKQFSLRKSLLESANWIYYPLVDLFFEKIMQKYDSDHIILNRFRSNTYFLRTNGNIERLPDSVKQHHQSNDKYNAKCRELEDYVIKKYNPYVIDLTKFYMCDENYWPDHIHGAHYEKEFYRETYDQIFRIINHETDDRYFCKPRFFDKNREGYSEDCQRNLNIEQGLAMIEQLVEDEDLLWINVLDKLYAKAPEHAKVQEYMRVISE